MPFPLCFSTHGFHATAQCSEASLDEPIAPQVVHSGSSAVNPEQKTQLGHNLGS